MNSRRVLFLGNSITRHEPKPEIGWTGNWGMAASSIEKDYVHLLIKMFTEKDGAEPESLIMNIADFEREFATYNIAENFKNLAGFNADIIILAIGENVPNLATDHDKTSFGDAISELLTYLKKTGNSPALFVRSSFWSNLIKDAILQQTSINAGGIFVDISNLDKNEANYARSERDYDHGGVAAHPGDAGMVAIADAIWNAVQKENLC